MSAIASGSWSTIMANSSASVSCRRWRRSKRGLTGVSLRLKAPGMLQLDVPFESEGDVIKVRVWNDEVAAVTQGEIADAWFSQFLGLPCRLMRFDPEAKRISNPEVHGHANRTVQICRCICAACLLIRIAFRLERRLAAKGHAEITIERFRPNIVLDGIEAFEEDYVDHLTIGDAKLQVVKPCVRCTVPNVDPSNR